MKIDKEYPATHSMSTAWYVVDEEGNVGIVDFNENGPVPMGCEETGIEDLTFYNAASKKEKYITLQYTDKQIIELLESGEEQDIEDFRSGLYIVKSEAAESFVNIIMPLLEEDDYISRLSQNSSVFFIEVWSDCAIKALESMHSKSFFEKSIYLDYYINDTYNNDDGIVWKKNFKSHPFYLYGQPYATDHLIEKVHTPIYPVKIEQLPERIQRGLIKLPFRFPDTDAFQIAEYAPFEYHYRPDYEIDGRTYCQLPIQSEQQALIANTSLPESATIECCNCRRCEQWQNCTHYDGAHFLEFCQQPTVLIISTHSTTRSSMHDYAVKRCEIHVSKSAIVTLTHGYPYDRNDYRRKVSFDIVSSMFDNCKSYLEETIGTINPQVIIAEEECVSILSEHYVIESHTIEVCETSFPFYVESEIERFSNEINYLAELPYRGETLERPIKPQ